MANTGTPIDTIQTSKHAGRLDIRPHALQRGLLRNISADDIEAALDAPSVQIVESYSSGSPSPSCLLLGQDGRGRDLHLVVAYTIGRVVTVYAPSMPWFISPTERA